MYEVVVFYKYDYDYTIKCFNILNNAEEYFDSIADEIEYEECPISMVVMYCNHKKVKEFKA